MSLPCECTHSAVHVLDVIAVEKFHCIADVKCSSCVIKVAYYVRVCTCAHPHIPPPHSATSGSRCESSVPVR